MTKVASSVWAHRIRTIRDGHMLSNLIRVLATLTRLWSGMYQIKESLVSHLPHVEAFVYW